MAIIYNINDYRNRKQSDRYEEGLAELRRIAVACGTWESEEERVRYHEEKAEKDLAEWEKMYPIKDIAE